MNRPSKPENWSVDPEFPGNGLVRPVDCVSRQAGLVVEGDIEENLLEVILGGCVVLCVNSKAVGEVDATISYTRRTALSRAALIRGHGGAYCVRELWNVVFPGTFHPFAGTALTDDQGQVGRPDEGFGRARGTSDGHFAICI
jgi:hypothetical protein